MNREPSVTKGMIKSIEFCQSLLTKCRSHCLKNEDVKIIDRHLNTLVKLKNLCLFALSDRTFDFNGSFREVEKKILKDINKLNEREKNV